jgi:hypothetical protein
MRCELRRAFVKDEFNAARRAITDLAVEPFPQNIIAVGG